MTILGLFNFVFAQWFFIRLAKVVNTDTKKVVKWKWLKGVIPLTGWISNFKRIQIKDKMKKVNMNNYKETKVDVPDIRSQLGIVLK